MSKKSYSIDFQESSQATYFFGVKKDNSKKSPENRIFIGSFAAILLKGNEYYILTAGHNIGFDVNNKNNQYFLFEQGGNKEEIELTLETNYYSGKKPIDTAILKVKNGEQFKSSNCIKNVLSFKNKYVNSFSKEPKYKISLCGFNTKTTEKELWPLIKYQYIIQEEDLDYVGLPNFGIGGDSGGCIIAELKNEHFLVGTYLGKIILDGDELYGRGRDVNSFIKKDNFEIY